MSRSLQYKREPKIMPSGSSERAPLEDFKALVDSCASFYEKNREAFDSKAIRERRKQLSLYTEKFHKDSATLTSAVRAKIAILSEEPSIVLMTAHQPNLFPYSGVLRKATLLSVLQKELERRLGVKVVSFYGIADQDFADDRWVKSSIIPSVTRRDGTLTLSADLPEKVILNNLPKPPRDTMKKWKDSIEILLHDSTYSIGRFCLSYGILDWSSKASLLHNNFEMFWRIVEEAYEGATTYSDFNAFVMSKIVNDAWQYDTLFSRFSECQRIFYSEFNFLLTRFGDYSASLREAIEHTPRSENSRGVSKTEPEYLPFWYHCDCGSKARLTLRVEDGSIMGHGSCIRCSRKYNVNLGISDRPDVSAVSSNISAKAIPMILVFSKGLGLSCYVGGIGGKEYLSEAQHVAEKLDIIMPLISYWRPHDFYLSISNLEALFEYKRISGNYEIRKWKKEVEVLKSRIESINDEINKLELERNEIVENLRKGKVHASAFDEEMRRISDAKNDLRKKSDLSALQYNLRELSNIPPVIMSIPSIIDYAINIGLRKTSDQWVNHLMNNGSLSSEIYMKSILEELKDNNPSNIFEDIYKSLVNLQDRGETYDLTGSIGDRT